jgi:nucleotide-binding universal stress UspA family protein
MSVERHRRPTRLVVGIDGSPPSKAALRWAIGYAALTDGVVDAVTAWDYPANYEWVPVVVEGEAFRDQAVARLEEAVREVAGREPLVKVVETVVQGHPAQILVDEARGADLLVVGSRGHGAFTSALVGSTSERCVRHALCPVVVVHSPAA